MKRTCDNCNRPLLDTDIMCWHCGHKQPLPDQPETPPEQADSDLVLEDGDDLETEAVASPLILFYGSLTAVVILALLLVIRSLGQSPTLSVKTDTLIGEWVTLSSPDKSFTVEIPVKWNWQFLKGMEQESALLENDGKIMTAIAPLGDLVPDIDYLLHAENDGAFLVITRSARLNRLSAQQAVTALQEESFANTTVTEARLIGTTAEEERAYFTLTHSDPPLHCEQYFLPTSPDAYVAAICSLPESSEQDHKTHQAVLDSFNVQSR